MAPAKNTHCTNNDNKINSSEGNNNCPSKNNGHDITPTQSAMFKETGTVPKIPPVNMTGRTTKRSSLPDHFRLPQNPEILSALMLPSNFTTPYPTCPNYNKADQRKNTKAVAPIQHELSDINECIRQSLASAQALTVDSNCRSDYSYHHAPPANGNEQLKSLQKTNIKCKFHKDQQQQQQPSQHCCSNLTDNCVATLGYNPDFVNETQRNCYLVRPTPRKNQHQNPQQNNSSNLTTIVNNSNQAAATSINVVAPNTASIDANVLVEANSNSNQDQQLKHQLQQILLAQLQQIVDESVNASEKQINLALPVPLPLPVSDIYRATTATINLTPTATVIANNSSNNKTEGAANITDLHALQHFLKLTIDKFNTNNSNNNCVTTANSPIGNKRQTVKMVHEINPKAADREVVVNSASLEDVAISEMGDNRAQSIQSLHSSVETPTPDNTPSYDDLQQRLETSNRNIQNIQEQQQQLLRLQNEAKHHLHEMERLRSQAGILSFSNGQVNGESSTDGNGDSTVIDSLPEYESLDQVHEDMAQLVGRMKNLTTFIQNQNNLSNILGEDGPEIVAEQEALQRKLESLRTHRDEMRSLVDELQDLNYNAEKFAWDAKQLTKDSESDATAVPDGKQTHTKCDSHNTSPVNDGISAQYSRMVPIELVQNNNQDNAEANGSTVINDMPADIAANGSHIRQKVADIEEMKSQLNRLKSMMDTVTLIETHTARNPRDIGRTPPRENLSRSSAGSSIERDHERTPVADEDDDPITSRKMRMLNEVTSDLKAQAESLQTERNRIKALKEEIIRRKAQAAAAVKLGDDALARHSLTPTPTPHNRTAQHEETGQLDTDQLKSEYETKKNEFEMLCQSIESENNSHNSHNVTSSRRSNMISEIDNESDEKTLKMPKYPTLVSKPQYCSMPPRSSNNHTSKSATASTDKARNDRVAAFLNSSCGSRDAANTNITPHINDSAFAQVGNTQSVNGRPFAVSSPIQAPGSNNWTGSYSSAFPPALNTNYLYTQPPPLPPPATISGQYPAQHLTPLSSVALPLPQSEYCSTAATSGGISTGNIASDPVLIQQFVQTQQMLISSICQCNQMLWHQQREIDALNNTICNLQERLHVLTMNTPSTSTLGFNLRSESMPPPNAAVTNTFVPRDSYVSGNVSRAQSEQPTAPFLPTQRNAYANYHHHQQQQQQRQRNAHSSNGMNGNGIYNYSVETQQQQQSASNASANIYATLNNASQAPPPPQFNNEAPQSPLANTGPGPIFMHHHNNAIHQNNANLRTQNHHANLQQPSAVTNLSAADGGTLNNQVPPGNRANNYWDNFRSYSRQNLFSTNSHKSNEEQQQNQQQQPNRNEDDYNPERPDISNLHRHHHHQHHHHHLYQPHMNNGNNNVNYEDNECSNKYLRSSLQRTRINQFHEDNITSNRMHNLNCSYFEPNTAEPPTSELEYRENLNWRDNLYDNYLLETDMPDSSYLPHSPLNLRNMNVNKNIGNSPHYQRNKVPAKYTYPSSSALTTLNRNHNRNRNHLQQTHIRDINETLMPQLQSHYPEMPYTSCGQQRFDILSSSLTTAVNNVAPLVQNERDRDRDREFIVRGLEDEYEYMRNLGTSGNSGGVLANCRYPNDDDDTTSEEVKRNLLVNALKNDKFTTKVYESIKEDVYRRLENMLLEKENYDYMDSEQHKYPHPHQHQHKHQQHYQQQQQLQPPPPPEFVNNVGSRRSVARDPTRKLYLNARQGNQQNQQHSSLPTTGASMRHDDLAANNQIDVESNNCDNAGGDTLMLKNRFESVDNDNKSELDENEESVTDGVTPLSATTNTMSLNWTCGVGVNVVVGGSGNNTKRSEPASNGSRNSNRKRKHQRKFETNAGESDKQTCGGAYGVIGPQPPPAPVEPNDNQDFDMLLNATDNESNTISTVVPDYDLISFIITRIKNQTHTNTPVNDTLLADIAKITATTVQNTARTFRHGATTVPPMLSPKKIYARIKKHGGCPRRRDEFLVWYQSYLEKIYQMEIHVYKDRGYKERHESSNKKLQKYNTSTDAKPKKAATSTGIETATATTVDIDMKHMNIAKRSMDQQHQQTKPQPQVHQQVHKMRNPFTIIKYANAFDALDIDDTDYLAEADQICSPKNNNGYKKVVVEGFAQAMEMANTINTSIAITSPSNKNKMGCDASTATINKQAETETTLSPDEEDEAATIDGASAAVCGAIIGSENLDKKWEDNMLEPLPQVDACDKNIKPNVDALNDAPKDPNGYNSDEYRPLSL